MAEGEGLKFDDIFGKWFWVSAGIIAAGVVVLAVLWYAKHPERSPFTDFIQPVDLPDTNGHVPRHAAKVGGDADEGEVDGLF